MSPISGYLCTLSLEVFRASEFNLPIAMESATLTEEDGRVEHWILTQDFVGYREDRKRCEAINIPDRKTLLLGMLRIKAEHFQRGYIPSLPTGKATFF